MRTSGPKEEVRLDVELNAVIVAVDEETPVVLVVGDDASPARRETPAVDHLPSGSLDLSGDRTLELGVRRWVKEQTNLELGYLEQLYTFGDRHRIGDAGRRTLSIAYLALTRQTTVDGARGPRWRPLSEYFPWEDRRSGEPEVLRHRIAPALAEWVDEVTDRASRAARQLRADVAFGLGTSPWDPNRILERYELLYEIGLVNDGRRRNRTSTELGRPMALDHRRMLATAFDRLRGKLSYRPVVFELLPPTFTLLQLQHLVEALIGAKLHKSNFRRLVEQAQLVEGTGTFEPAGRGRPAELFRFRQDVLRERPAPGVGLPRSSPARRPPGG